VGAADHKSRRTLPQRNKVQIWITQRLAAQSGRAFPFSEKAHFSLHFFCLTA